METDLFERMIEAVYGVYGAHAGHRALHAKGTVCEGTFTATPDAAKLTRAAHMHGAPVPVTVRFSNGGGKPDAPDYERDGRGMSVKFHTAGGDTDIVALSLPVFFVRTPEAFLELMAARVPDPATGQPDLAKVGAFLQTHPEAQGALGLALAMTIPRSYVHVTYHGVHAFRWIGASGESRYVRYRFDPDAGDVAIGEDEARALGPDFLQHGLAANLPARFTLRVQLAADEDDVTDPTTQWPADRETLVAGSLMIERVASDQAAGERMVFDPTRVVDGIECSDDQILHARRGAYDVSIRRRYEATGA